MHSHLYLDTRASVSALSSPSPNLRHIVRYRAAIDQNSGGQFVEGLFLRCRLVAGPSPEAAVQCYPRTLTGEDRRIRATRVGAGSAAEAYLAEVGAECSGGSTGQPGCPTRNA
jgi:hypothetical protein